MFGFALFACLFALAVGDISQNCLNCICQVEGCQSQIGKCRMDVGSLSCGPFQIKYPYWQDCGSPGGDYQTCTKQMDCSVTCVRAYMSRYATMCTQGRDPTCQDYARIHNGGPYGCRSGSTIGYWRKVQACCQAVGGCGFDSSGRRLYYEAGEKDAVFNQLVEDGSEA